MDGPRIALKVNDRDNVATIFANGIHNGSEVELRDKKGFVETLTVHGEIPYGHKIAVRDIKLGELIFKYGEEIGIATQNIRKGDHVHIQNLDSLRGRGDLHHHLENLGFVEGARVTVTAEAAGDLIV